MNYQAYCTMCKKHRIKNPYESEEHYNRAYGIVEREEPLVIRPKHKESLESLASIVNNVRHKKSKRHKQAVDRAKAIKEPKPKKIVAPKEPRRTYRSYTSEKVSIKNMSIEEKRAHKAKLARERRAIDKANGTLKKLSEDQREKQRIYSRENYHANREARRAQVKQKRASMSEEEKAARKAYMKEYQKKNREAINARERERKRKRRSAAKEKRESLLLSQKSGSANRSHEPMSAVA